MKNITTLMRRFSIYLGDNSQPIEADARMSMKDELTKADVGLTWFTQFEDHAEVGVARDVPYIVIDHEYPYSMQDFLSMAIKEEELKKPDPRDAQ